MISLMVLVVTVGFEEAVLRLSGATEMEELDESAVEMYEELSRHPLAVNCVGKSRLLSCGLFSRYQVAALLDYRQRCGDVLSLTELGAIDGFGAEFADALKEFVSLDGSAGQHGKAVRQSMTLRASGRMEEASGRLDGADASACGGLKYHAEIGDRVELNWCDRNTYADPKIGPGTFNAAYYGKRRLGEIVVGDYNARFGQGLLMWTGFSLSGVSSAQSLWRSATGLSPSRSFTSRCRGAAADCDFGRWCVSAAFDIGSGRPRGIANVNRTGRIWQAGLTGVAEEGRKGLSADWRVGYGGGAMFGEVALERGISSTALACVAGAFWMPSHGTTLSVAARAYPKSFSGSTSGAVRASTKTSDEYGLSLAFQNGWMTATADAVRHPSKDTRQVKAILHLKPEFDLGGVSLKPALRASGRYSPASNGRYDLRAEIGAGAGKFLASFRFNVVHCREWAWLSYAEAGWKGRLTLWLRGGFFRVDNWDDRIYVYERDAPGSFNVPACYGRGWNASAVAGLKAGACHSFWLRASAVAYPWMADKKGRWELKLQYSLSINTPCRKPSRE